MQKAWLTWCRAWVRSGCSWLLAELLLEDDHSSRLLETSQGNSSEAGSWSGQCRLGQEVWLWKSHEVSQGARQYVSLSVGHDTRLQTQQFTSLSSTACGTEASSHDYNLVLHNKIHIKVVFL